MPSGDSELLLCYNKGCGQKYDPNKNTPESCIHHPGAPFFHDAYKGWSCCKKKCTDFTEFLNIKGCSKSYHSNVKPAEPEKPPVDKTKSDEVIEYVAPRPPETPALERPPFDTPLVVMKPIVSSGLRDQVAKLVKSSEEVKSAYDGTGQVPVGTNCKNNGCKQVYEGEQTLLTQCTFHPGYPVFHEGLKFWTCCNRRTTDFNSFLEQEGCTTGQHLWYKQKTAGGEVKCRVDWHQTGSFVVVSIFAKKYDPDVSTIELSPVRLKASLFFPEENGSFTTDLELRGIVNVNESSVSMLQTKVEIKLRKAECGSWSKLDFPRTAPKEEQQEATNNSSVSNLVPQVDAVDLSDL